MTHRRNRWHKGRRLYRDRENGWIMGVCAGVAQFFDWNVLAVRGIVAILLVFNTLPTALVYFATGILLRDKPLHYSGPEDEARFWRRDHA